MCTEDREFIESVASGFYCGYEILAVPSVTTSNPWEACEQILEAFEKHR